jgi:hypothetical protein
MAFENETDAVACAIFLAKSATTGMGGFTRGLAVRARVLVTSACCFSRRRPAECCRWP